MSPHSGTGVSILQLSCLSLLSIAEAFELSVPSSTFPGDSLAVSWTSSDGPKDFNLQVGFCGGEFDGPILFNQPDIDTQASNLRHASIPKILPSGLEPPVQCSVKAFDSETGDLLDSSPVELQAQGPTSTLVSSPKSTMSTLREQKSTTHQIVTIITPPRPPVSAPTIKSSPSPDTPQVPHSPIPSSSTNPSPSSSDPPLQSTVLPTSSISPLPSASTISTTSGGILPTTLGSITTTISVATPSHSSSRSKDAKRPIGPLLGEVLGSVFALLAVLLIALFIWCRRRRSRRQNRSAEPFVPDDTYSQPRTKQEEFANERAANGTGGTDTMQPNQESAVPLATDQKIDLERGDPVRSLRSEMGTGKGTTRAGKVKVKGTEAGTGTRTGTGTRAGAGTGSGSGTVEEEVTMLRERLMALEDQHRELTGELRSAVIIPPQYSR